MTRRPVRNTLALLALLALFAGALATGPHAAGAESLTVRIRETALDPSGKVRLVVSVSGEGVADVLGAESFAVREAGEPVEDFALQPLLTSEARPVAVVLVMDVSGSTAGRPLADAKAAAKAFVDNLPAQVTIALIAFGPAAEVRSGFTTDRGLLAAAIDALETRGETALYDAAAMAAGLLQTAQAQRDAVIFSDGKDTVSQATLEQAVAAARETKARFTSVGLVTPDFDPAALEALASATGGRSLPVERSGELESAFRQVARDIASQYVITYTATRTRPKELDLSVEVTVGGATASDAVTVVNPRVAPPPEQPPGGRPSPGPLSSPIAFYLGVAALFLALALLFGLLLGRAGAGRATRVLRKGLGLYSKVERGEDRHEGSRAGTEIGRRAVSFIEHLPQSRGRRERTQVQLERAAWPLRASEFMLLQAGAAAVGWSVGLALSGRWPVGLTFGLAGAFAPRFLLSRRVEKRSSDFVTQLPDTLQLLAGSLQAGYGFMQAVDTVSKESSPPTSTEFGRVLTEARLGTPLNEAFDAMAERMGSEDFRWVVIAINIQRQSGGNLAALLETVGNTLRERDQLRRQVKVLSAEGRLSAVILTVLPFALASYLALVNRTYLRPLVEVAIGKVLIVVALLLMGAGVLWMRKLVRIEV